MRRDCFFDSLAVTSNEGKVCLIRAHFEKIKGKVKNARKFNLKFPTKKPLLHHISQLAIL